jgi:hypothetical protein
MTSLRPRTALLVLLSALGLAVVGGGTRAQVSASGKLTGVIDGWGIGDPFTCTDADPDRPCSVLLPLAQQALDNRDPLHPTVVGSRVYTEGPDASGNLVTRSTPFLVAVFQLSDGSAPAIGVDYPGVSTTPMTLPFGP